MNHLGAHLDRAARHEGLGDGSEMTQWFAWHAARRQELALLTGIIFGSAGLLGTETELAQANSIHDAFDAAETILKLSYERYYGK